MYPKRMKRGKNKEQNEHEDIFKPIDIAYELLGVTPINIDSFKIKYGERLKQLTHLRPLEIVDIIVKEKLKGGIDIKEKK